MKIKKLTFLIYFLICSISNIYADNEVQKEITPIHDSKIDSLAKISLIDSKDENFIIICKFIEANWKSLMKISQITKANSYQLITFDESFLTVHPEANEICIFFKTHTKHLGEGFFKRVIKGLAYNREKEVAIAFPKGSLIDQYYHNKMTFTNTHNIDSRDFSSESYDSFTSWYSDWSTYDYSYYSFDNSYDDESYESNETSNINFDFESSDIDMWADTTDSTGLFFSPFNWKKEQELNEIRMLMKAQACKAVTKLFFISFPETIENDQSPIIVQQFYNGGSLGHYLSKRQLSKEEKLLVYHDTLMAISDIHDQNIIHNDLHFGNILVQENQFTKKIDEIVVGDFGISKEIDPNIEYSHLQKKEDLKYLFSNLVHITFDDENITKLVFQLIIKNELEIPTKEIFNYFVKEVKNLVTDEEYNYITKNSIQNRALKYKNGNTIVWQ